MLPAILLPLSLLVVDLASAQDSSLKIDITNIVSCARKSHAGDNVSVNYNGTLTTGEQFDSSMYTPLYFIVGKVCFGLVDKRTDAKRLPRGWSTPVQFYPWRRLCD